MFPAGLLQAPFFSLHYPKSLNYGAMGVVMGDLLAAEFNLDWVVYEDRLGRSRALRDGDSDNYLFPITMISRRREVDNRTPVVDIYRKAADIITASRPPLPFQ